MNKTKKKETKDLANWLPVSALHKLLKFIENLTISKVEKKPLQTYRLKGKFDDEHIRSQAYE
jgi:hypothetical protein